MTFGKIEKRLRQSFEKEETLGKSHIQENRILQPVSGCRNTDTRNAPTRKFRNFSNSSNQYLEIQNPLYNSDSRHIQTFRSQNPGNSEIQISRNSEIQNFKILCLESSCSDIQSEIQKLINLEIQRFRSAALSRFFLS